MKLIKSFLLIFILFSSAAMAQEANKRVAFDSGEKVFVLDKNMEAQVKLFPKILDFKKATISQLNDTSYIVEVQSENNLTKIKINENKYYQVQAKIDRYLKQAQPKVESTNLAVDKPSPQVKAPAPQEIGEGRNKLIRSIRELSFFAYGWMIPAGLGATSSAGYIGGYMMITGGSIVLPYVVTSNGEVPVGAASLFRGAASLGLAHGLLLHLTLAPDINNIGKGVFLTMTGVSIGEGLAMYSIAKNSRISIGEAELMTTNSAFAGLAGASFLASANLFDNNTTHC
jgi:hypothetical protein